MTSLRVPFRLTLAGSVLAVLLLTAAATVAGYLVETHQQQADREHRLATAQAYASQTAASLRTGLAPAEAQRFEQALPGKLAGLGVGAQLTLISPTAKRLLYASSVPAAQQPVGTYIFPLAGESGTALALDLYPPPPDRNRPLLVALACGLGALLAGSTLLIWTAGRWLVAPLGRLNVQVDAIAGGDRIETQASSPIQEVNNVAAAVAGMAARLEQGAAQDARAEAERGLLVSSIAHDLRTPLFALRGYLEAIAAGIGNPAERLDRARAKADQIDRLVTRLFDYARAEIEERPLQATDLAAAVSDVVAAFEFAAGERDVDLRISIGAATTVTIEVAIDRDGFERALANVIDNALHHAPRGGTVDVGCGEDAEGAFIRVIDDGPGFAPDLLPRIFEPMARVDQARNQARNSRTGGAGLGLAIAARLLRNQGGTILAANAPERGAMVTLRLKQPRPELP